MIYSGDYAGTIHTFCADFNYTDPIAFIIGDDGSIDLPGSAQGQLQDGRIDDAGHVSGLSITVRSLSLGTLKIPYAASDDGTTFRASGTSQNGITSVIQATLVSPLPVTTIDNGDGTHRITASGDDLTLRSIGNDVMTGGGARQTFAFTPGFGQDDITNFVVGGRNHDTIDLSATRYHSPDQVLRHTTMTDGDATIHLNPGDSITLHGVSRAQLKAHPQDFVFG